MKPPQVDKGIPIPKAMRGPRSLNARTVLQMADGDSVFKKTLKEAEVFRDCLQYYNFKAVVRRRYQGEHGEEGYRVWKSIKGSNAKLEQANDIEATRPAEDPVQRSADNPIRKDNKRIIKPARDERNDREPERHHRSVGKGTRY